MNHTNIPVLGNGHCIISLWFSRLVYLGFDEKINSPGSQKVPVVLVLLSLQQVPVIDPNTGNQSRSNSW